MLTVEELAERKHYIGGSDIPIIMGLSTYKTPYQLYCEKKGLLTFSQEETEQQYWGKMLEPKLKEHFESIHNVTIDECNARVHPELPFLRGNLDGYIREENAVWEAKCSNAFLSHIWEGEGIDAIPAEYIVQVATYCSIMRADKAYFSVLIGGSTYKEFTFVPNPALERNILEAASMFWHCLQNDIEPPPVDLDDLKIKYSKPKDGLVVTAEGNIEQEILMLKALRKEMNKFSEQETKHKFNIMSFMQDAEYLQAKDNTILATWRANKKGVRSLLIKGGSDE